MSRILIIEDDSKIRAILKEILQEKDHDTEEAADGQEGLKKLEAGSFDLCICDIKMPKMDGLEVLQKAKEAGIGTNFVIISAHGNIDIAVEAVKKGALTSDAWRSPFGMRSIRVHWSKRPGRFVRRCRASTTWLVRAKQFLKSVT
jgi:two-component system nitrogen regulation response regulator NtrX